MAVIVTPCVVKYSPPISGAFNAPLGHTNVSPEILNSSELILWHLIPKVPIQKINTQVWPSYMKKKTTITKEREWCRRQILIGTSTGTFHW